PGLVLRGPAPGPGHHLPGPPRRAPLVPAHGEAAVRPDHRPGPPGSPGRRTRRQGRALAGRRPPLRPQPPDRGPGHQRHDHEHAHQHHPEQHSPRLHHHPMTRAPRRDTELGLIVLVALITAGAYALASLGKSASLPANIGPFLAIILAMLAVAHVAVRRLAPRGDAVLLPVAGLLNGLGYVFIARLDQSLAGLQAVWPGLGILAFVATLVVVRQARDLERYRYSFALLGVGLLMMPLLPVVGRNINGARLWVRLGPINFQPGEMAKITLGIFFAAYLVEKRELLSDFGKGRLLPQPRAIGPILLAWGASILVMTAEKDLGSSLLFFTLFISMLWLATDRGAYLGIGAVLFGVG